MTMSRAWYVRCTDCGNPAEISTSSAAEARRYARAQGFIRVFRDGKWVDLGPCHAEDWDKPPPKNS